MAAPVALVADFWRSRGWAVTVLATQAPGHATFLAQEAAAAGQNLVLAAGGDGTLGEVANGLIGTETVMGLLPVGTGNSFAKELLLPLPSRWNKHKLLQAADALAAGRVQWMDVGFTLNRDAGQGRPHGRYWLLWSGTGGDGYLVDRLEPRPKWSKKLGIVGYTLQSLAIVPQLPSMEATVEVDGRFFTDQFLLIVVSNCRRYAGGELTLTPQAELDDGLFEVWLFRGDGLPKIMQYLLAMKAETHEQLPDVTLVKGRRVTVETKPVMPVHTDGERAGKSPLTCEIRPSALRVLVPQTAPPDLFSRPGEPLFD